MYNKCLVENEQSIFSEQRSENEDRSIRFRAWLIYEKEKKKNARYTLAADHRGLKNLPFN